ncbi:MAG: anti-sigma factor antagonist [Thermoleophilaceae bacterium]|jgi:stage II sporulation protein AA (anti-sigma F factor antagonist)|nr:anti-sigma factor antagonist [Thermoleophilaceae bacterium]
MGTAVFEVESVDEYIHVVAVTGEIDLSNASGLVRQVETAVRSGRNCVVIDLSRVTHMDSTGLAALIEAHHLTHARRGRLALVSGSESVRRTIEVRGLDRLFVIEPSRDHAVASVRDRSD